MHRRTAIKGIAMSLAAGVVSFYPGVYAASEFNVNLFVDFDKSASPVNRLILGNNLQWFDGGDELLLGDGIDFDAKRLALVRDLKPTVLRYPGGSMSDTYHWRNGIGDLKSRRQNESFGSRSRQTVRLGTVEFLELCELVGALPLITVNIPSGTPQEAADWVAFTNKQRSIGRNGKALPSVMYWEIGNEPYLQDEKRKELWLKPDEFARRATATIEAMRAVDPRIKVGIPLRSDKIGDNYATPLQGFNQTLLSQLKTNFDYACVHNAYLPFVLTGKPSEAELYMGAMGASSTTEEDLDFTKRQLSSARGKDIPLAITEYNATFTLKADGSKSDRMLTSVAGALYVADVLRIFATRTDILMANFWSLSNNWLFGAIGRNNQARPAYHVLKFFDRALNGSFVQSRIVAPSFSTPKVGFAMARKEIPLISGLATREKNVVRIVLINKHPANAANVRFTLPKLKKNPLLSQLSGSTPYDDNEQNVVVVPRNSEVDSKSSGFQLPAASISLLEMSLDAGA